MLFPREMTEIELIVPSKDLLAVTKVLIGYGVFHQTDSNYQGVATGSTSTWQETAGQYSALERPGCTRRTRCSTPSPHGSRRS